MKEIPLTQGKVTLVDDEDFDYLMQWKWCFHQRYAVRNVYENRKPKTILMHREILRPHEGVLVDHIDGDGLNNQRSNLREATRAQNAWNAGKTSRWKHSAFKGVSRERKRKRTLWVARITVNKRCIHLGYFTSEIAAAHAYDQATKKHHGDFAYQNLQGEDDATG